MAATIATAIGNDSTRRKETHRLGSQSAEGRAATWRTFASVIVTADGRWSVLVKRDGLAIHFAEGGAE